MNDTSEQKNTNDDEYDSIDALADTFLDLWQDNIRNLSKERDLFTLQSLRDRIGRDKEKQGVSDGA